MQSLLPMSPNEGLHSRKELVVELLLSTGHQSQSLQRFAHN